MEVLKEIEQTHRKPALPQVQSGDTVRVHQVIREGSKRRVQIFEGLIIRSHRLGEISAVITVRRIASGVGVEKTFLLHSPNITKVEIIRRSKVRRNFLSYLRARRGKSARLQEITFDKTGANVTEVATDKTNDDTSKANEAEIEQLSAEQATDDQLDAEVTEISSESTPADVSTEDVAKDENKAAAADDDVSMAQDPEGGDDQQNPADEVQSGLDRAENEDTRAQRPVT